VLGDVGARRVLDLAVGIRTLDDVAKLARAMVPAESAARADRGAPAVLAK
jgi:hypothetical protein